MVCTSPRLLHQDGDLRATTPRLQISASTPVHAYFTTRRGKQELVGGVVHHENSNRRSEDEMTGLGASIYLGFFVLAAVWLFLTSDGPLTDGTDEQGQRPERSNSTNTDANSEGSSPWLVSHSSQK